jgi:hypothetical protein
MIIPIWLLAWLAFRWVGKIPNKTVRTICYVVLVVACLFAVAALDEAWFKFCYKGHC